MIAEALRVLTVMVPVLRPVDPHSGLFVDSFPAYKPCMQKVGALCCASCVVLVDIDVCCIVHYRSSRQCSRAWRP